MPLEALPAAAKLLISEFNDSAELAWFLSQGEDHDEGEHSHNDNRWSTLHLASPQDGMAPFSLMIRENETVENVLLRMRATLERCRKHHGQPAIPEESEIVLFRYRLDMTTRVTSVVPCDGVFVIRGDRVLVECRNRGNFRPIPLGTVHCVSLGYTVYKPGCYTSAMQRMLDSRAQGRCLWWYVGLSAVATITVFAVFASRNRRMTSWLAGLRI